VQENNGPSVTPGVSNDLYNQSGWVRGVFPADLVASDPSGICGLQTQVNGGILANWADPTPDTTNWSQCPGSTLPASVNTAQYSNGPGTIKLSYAARNAAGVITTITHSINVDNTPVGVTISGPGDALSTNGTQYVTATASAGPSGANIFCSVDGGAEVEYPGPTARVPVSGLGGHQVSCYATNNAIDATGTPLRSGTDTFDLSIRQPTAEAVSFAKIVGLHCHKVTVHTRVRGRERTVKRHGKTVEIPGRIRTVTRHVRDCGGRVIRKLVTVTVARHGKIVKERKVVKVIVPPHTVTKTTIRVRYGRATTVSGFLALTSGTPLGGRTVQIVAAPNNGQGQFAPIAAATTTASGTWTARIPAGPSRLVEAIYGGDNTTEPAISTIVKTFVPARVTIRIAPRTVPWGSEIRVTGRVLGGYVPTDSNLLRLNVGIGRIGQLEGLPQIQPDGRFVILWKFNQGRGVLHPWFSVGTLSETAFPFSPSDSKRVVVTVGK
jgi:hypothetical protein